MISVSASMSIVSIYVDGCGGSSRAPTRSCRAPTGPVDAGTVQVTPRRGDLGALARRDRDYDAAAGCDVDRAAHGDGAPVSVEIEEYVLELGVNGRQVSLQLEADPRQRHDA